MIGLVDLRCSSSVQGWEELVELPAAPALRWSAFLVRTGRGLGLGDVVPWVEGAFGFDFPIVYDDHGAWRDALINSRMPRQGAALVRDGWIAGTASLGNWNRLVGGWAR